ncbi:hypothetical protein HY468_04330 [Candidatus Roizmanbacteria bacterium]|nr:hypothetical protein [Candidatus Roizmanbacteria bacterium]
MDVTKRKKELALLIVQARKVKALPYNNPDKDLWRQHAKLFLGNSFGSEYEKIFDDALWWGEGPFQQDQYHILHEQAMTRAIRYLIALKEEKPHTSHQKLSKKDREALKSSYEHIVISNVSGGNFVLGNATIAQVTVHDMVTLLRKEIEKSIPDTPAKQSVLDSLREITENETFANIAGALLGQLLK